MADYWKSLPRKFCEFCKCWITDNKPSVEFHERGKRHKENVEKKINEVRKKGQKAWEQEKAMMKDIEAMEQAALKAYEKDLKENPGLIRESMPDLHSVSTPKTVSSSSVQVVQHFPAPVKFKAKKKKKITCEPAVAKDSICEPAVAEDSISSQTIVKEWYEGLSDEGYTYYWNISTGESKWEVPEDGFVSMNEQSYQNTTELPTEEITDEKISNEIEDEGPDLEKSDDSETSATEVGSDKEQSAESEDDNEEKCDINKSSEENSSEDKSNEKCKEEKSIDAEISVSDKELVVTDKITGACSEEEKKTELKNKSSEVFIKRKSAYGEWVTVTTEAPVDWELPDRGITEIKVPSIIPTNESKFKFKEKTLSRQSGYCEPIAFKKRKVDGQKKNMRQRDTENS